MSVRRCSSGFLVIALLTIAALLPALAEWNAADASVGRHAIASLTAAAMPCSTSTRVLDAAHLAPTSVGHLVLHTAATTHAHGGRHHRPLRHDHGHSLPSTAHYRVVRHGHQRLKAVSRGLHALNFSGLTPVVSNARGSAVASRDDASPLDRTPNNPISQYWIWRQVPSLVAANRLESGAYRVGSADEAASNEVGVETLSPRHSSGLLGRSLLGRSLLCSCHYGVPFWWLVVVGGITSSSGSVQPSAWSWR